MGCPVRAVVLGPAGPGPGPRAGAGGSYRGPRPGRSPLGQTCGVDQGSETVRVWRGRVEMGEGQTVGGWWMGAGLQACTHFSPEAARSWLNPSPFTLHSLGPGGNGLRWLPDGRPRLHGGGGGLAAGSHSGRSAASAHHRSGNGPGRRGRGR